MANCFREPSGKKKKELKSSLSLKDKERSNSKAGDDKEKNNKNDRDFGSLF
jgi:hypothetical protein